MSKQDHKLLTDLGNLIHQHNDLTGREFQAIAMRAALAHYEARDLDNYSTDAQVLDFLQHFAEQLLTQVFGEEAAKEQMPEIRSQFQKFKSGLMQAGGALN